MAVTTGFLSALAIQSAPAQARMVCTVVADAASGRIVERDGDCATRVTPASTFKLPLALMGYDAGFLIDAKEPVLPFRKGYADWGGAEWQRPVDPASWMKHSVVWYSQRITRKLGIAGLTKYAQGFSYGNADFSGDPGKDNALDRAWITSSLKISPDEQVAFLRALARGDLPVSREAIRKTRMIVETQTAPNGWAISGKTGSAYPRKADGTLDRARGWGWFVGWASKGDITLVFARLDQDERRTQGRNGLRARDAFVDDFARIAAQADR